MVRQKRPIGLTKEGLMRIKKQLACLICAHCKCRGTCRQSPPCRRPRQRRHSPRAAARRHAPWPAAQTRAASAPPAPAALRYAYASKETCKIAKETCNTAKETHLFTDIMADLKCSSWGGEGRRATLRARPSPGQGSTRDRAPRRSLETPMPCAAP